MDDDWVLPHLIDGAEHAPAGGRTFDNTNPWDGTVNQRVAAADQHLVDTAVNAARAAHADGRWSQLSPQERGRVLHRLADLIEKHGRELAAADSRDMGRPESACRGFDVPRAAGNFRFFADHVRLSTAQTYPSATGHHSFLSHEAAGVVAAITPWNHPLMLGTWKVAAPLAWGNTVVHKPAEVSPTSAYLVGQLALEAGLPPGVLNVVQGPGAPTGAALAAAKGVDRITFTGSTATGRAICRAAADQLTPVSLELGGKGATVIFEDAGLDEAATLVARAVFSNSGQVCLSTGRIYVHRSRYEALIDLLVAKAQALQVGDPADPGTDLGPLVSAAQHRKVNDFFDLVPAEGGTVHTGGPGEGLTFLPSVVSGLRAGGRLCREEIFGPIALVLPFDTEEEAVLSANDTEYGLSGVICTRDLDRAHRVARRMRAGTVWINCYQVRDLRAPLGGPGDSGIGREGGDFSRDFLTEPKVTTIAVR